MFSEVSCGKNKKNGFDSLQNGKPATSYLIEPHEVVYSPQFISGTTASGHGHAYRLGAW